MKIGRFEFLGAELENYPASSAARIAVRATIVPTKWIASAITSWVVPPPARTAAIPAALSATAAANVTSSPIAREYYDTRSPVTGRLSSHPFRTRRAPRATPEPGIPRRSILRV
jgi:hypothetical protein